MPPTFNPTKLIIRIMLGPGTTPEIAKIFANSRSVTQPCVVTKLCTSGRTEGNPPKLIDESSARRAANARVAEESFMRIWRW